MSAQLHALLAEERARDFAERPFADEPLISDMQCDAVDETGQHLDIEPIQTVEEEEPWLLWLYITTAALSFLFSLAWPKEWS